MVRRKVEDRTRGTTGLTRFEERKEVVENEPDRLGRKGR